MTSISPPTEVLDAAAPLVSRVRHSPKFRMLTVARIRDLTPRMRRIYAKQGQPYTPKALLNPGDVARLVVALTELPVRVEVTDVQLRSLTPY